MFVKIFFRGMVITLSSGCVVARYIRKMLELIKNFGCNNLCNNSFFFFFFFQGIYMELICAYLDKFCTNKSHYFILALLYFVKTGSLNFLAKCLRFILLISTA